MVARLALLPKEAPLAANCEALFVSFLALTRRGRSRPALALVAGLALALLAAPGLAQQGGDSVTSRLGRLEEKVRDLQVTIGTLQTFSGKPAATLSQEAPAPVPQVTAVDAALGPRIDALETQITALTSHLERIGKQMSALEAKLTALEAAPPTAPLVPPAEPPPLRQGTAPLEPSGGSTAALGAVGGGDDNASKHDPSKPRWYGPKPGSGDLAALLESRTAESPADRPTNLTAALHGGKAQSLYQQGYSALLQKDYAAAEGAFRHLLETYPSDPLAGDAQYWIGETYYVRGQYKNAADAFLNGYKKYKSGQKAPDSLLKLGMSLAELGQKDAACSTFDELKTKFPQAPEHIGDEAKAWRKKTGC
jgi:tol-pal system protein YbgF